MTKLKSYICLIVTLILGECVLCLSVAVSVLNQYKIKNVTGQIMKRRLLNLLFHPISTISGLISKNNPVLIIGTIILLIYMAYVVYRSSNKGTYEIETKYAVHGSSRFANNNEIFVENETIGVPVEQIFKDLKSSIRERGESNEGEE